MCTQRGQAPSSAPRWGVTGDFLEAVLAELSFENEYVIDEIKEEGA